MARNPDFDSYCNNLLNDPSDLINFDNLSRDSPMEPLVYYDLQPVSEPIKEWVIINNNLIWNILTIIKNKSYLYILLRTSKYF